MVTNSPRRSWQSSITGPMYSSGVKMVASTYGSWISWIRAGSGSSSGFRTSWTWPCRSTTR